MVLEYSSLFLLERCTYQSKITRDKAASKREERLLMSTVYELGMDTIEKQLRSSVRRELQ